jgi:hypothetical protein
VNEATEKHARVWSDNLKRLDHYRGTGTDGKFISNFEIKYLNPDSLFY